MNDLQKVAGQYLKDLADGVVPRDSRYGICHHVYRRFPDGVDITSHFGDWYAYTGVALNPVPDPECLDPKLAYTSAFMEARMWSGPYGEMRKQLCRFLGRRLLGEE